MGYVIDEQDIGRQRLLAHILNRLSEPYLARLGPTCPARWLDVGCGLGETTKMLTRFMSIDSECVGLDADPALLEVARSQDWAGRLVSFRQGDATSLPFEDDSFDFVFTRYLLVHLPNPGKAISEMLRVARPSGIVFAQEPDFAFNCCYPPRPSHERIAAMFAAAFPDAQIGRKLVHLFRTAGAKSPVARADIGIEYDSADLKKIYRMTFAALGAALVRAGGVSESEFSDLLDDFSRVEADPSIVVIGNPVIAVWTSA